MIMSEENINYNFLRIADKYMELEKRVQELEKINDSMVISEHKKQKEETSPKLSERISKLLERIKIAGESTIYTENYHIPIEARGYIVAGLDKADKFLKENGF